MTDFNSKFLDTWLSDKRILWYCLGIALVCYFPSRNAGFVMDYLGWLTRWETMGWAGIPSCFGSKSLLHVLQISLFLLNKVFGPNSWAWYLFFAGMHGMVGYLLYRFYQRLLTHFELANARPVILLAVLLFLINPYNGEPVIWRVCLHYMYSAASIIGVMYLVLRYYENRDKRHLIWAFIIYAVSLFTLEIVVVTPVLTSLLIWILLQKDQKLREFLPLVSRIVLPLVLLFCCYLVLNRIVLGRFIGHYGVEAITGAPLLQILSAFLKYFFKYFFFLRFFPESEKMEAIYALDNWFVVSIVLLAALIITFQYLRKVGFYSSGLIMTGFSLLSFFICFVPFITLYFVFYQYSENDRFGYTASMFLSLFLSLLLFLPPLKIRRWLIGAYVVLSLFFLQKINFLWATGCDIEDRLVSNFNAYGHSEVYILNAPDNYNGVYLFRVPIGLSGLEECLQYVRKKKFEGKLVDVMQYNMQQPWNRVDVRKDSADHFTVKLVAHGAWFWINGVGAYDYENEQFAVRVNKEDMNQSYQVHFKNIAPDAAILYQDGGEWKSVAR